MKRAFRLSEWEEWDIAVTQFKQEMRHALESLVRSIWGGPVFVARKISALAWWL